MKEELEEEISQLEVKLLKLGEETKDTKDKLKKLVEAYRATSDGQARL